MERSKISLMLVAAFCVLMMVVAPFSLIINGPPKHEARRKTDQEMIRDSASSLDAYCDQKPDECAGN